MKSHIIKEVNKIQPFKKKNVSAKVHGNPSNGISSLVRTYSTTVPGSKLHVEDSIKVFHMRTSEGSHAAPME